MKHPVLIGLALLGLVLIGSFTASADTAFKRLEYTDLINTVRATGSKVVLVNIYSMYCPACATMMPHLTDLRKTFTKDQLSIIGICLDDPDDAEALKAYIKKAGLDFPIYMGDEDIGVALQVRFIPRTLLYAPDGALLEDWTGVPNMSTLASAVNRQLAPRAE